MKLHLCRSLNWNSGGNHEVGYDAFMTGCGFAQASNHLGFDLELHSPFSNLANDEKLRRHINLLYLSWFNGEIIDLGTGKQTAESSTNSLKTSIQRSCAYCFNMGIFAQAQGKGDQGVYLPNLWGLSYFGLQLG